MTLSNKELLCEKLSQAYDLLFPVTGELMRRACMDVREHPEKCTCTTCKSFDNTHKTLDILLEVLKEIKT